MDLIETAKALAEAADNKPKQAYLRRAVSTAYYAMFHCMAKCCADMLVGTVSAQRSDEAWRQAYRALDHGFAKNACRNERVLQRFPQEVQDFANWFVSMQLKRHIADYDPEPETPYFKSEVLNDIAASEAAIKSFKSASVKDRRAFAIWLLLKERPQ